MGAEWQAPEEWFTGPFAAGVQNASVEVSGIWDDGTDDGSRTFQVTGPIAKGVHRVGRFNWQVGYSGTAGERNVVMVPGIKRHWFRWTAERAHRRGRP